MLDEAGPCWTWASIPTTLEAADARQRQTLLFSATIPPEIDKLAQPSREGPAEGRAPAPPRPSSSPSTTCTGATRTPCWSPGEGATSARRWSPPAPNDGANKVAKAAPSPPRLSTATKSQAERLKNFKNGKTRVLADTRDSPAASTSTGCRTHRLDLPNIPETTCTASGRTGRARAEGHVCVSFCDQEEKVYRDIVKLDARCAGGERTPFAWRQRPVTPADTAGERGPRRNVAQDGRGQQRGDQNAWPPKAKVSSGIPVPLQEPASQTRTGIACQRPAPCRSAGQRSPGRSEACTAQRDMEQARTAPEAAPQDNNNRNEQQQQPRQGTRESPQDSAAKPDYDAMVAELFGDVLPEVRKDGGDKERRSGGGGRRRRRRRNIRRERARGATALRPFPVLAAAFSSA